MRRYFGFFVVASIVAILACQIATSASTGPSQAPGATVAESPVRTLYIYDLALNHAPTLSLLVAPDAATRPSDRARSMPLAAASLPPISLVAAAEGDGLRGSQTIGHGGHQFPTTGLGKSQFFDNVNLADLSDTGDAQGYLQPNGNLRFVMHGPPGGDVGVDATTGMPTDIYTVIKSPDGAVVTIYPGTSPKG